MAKVDSLEIEIQSSVNEVNKQLDALVGRLSEVSRGITAIRNNKAFESIAKSASEVSNSMKVVRESASNAMAGVREQAQKASASIEEIRKQFENTYKDLGKGFTFKGSTDAVQKQIDRYTNALEKAKLKAQELEQSGKTSGSMYEYAIRDIQKYTNMIESLREQLGKIDSDPKDVEIKIHGTENAKRTLDDFVQELRDFDAIIESGQTDGIMGGLSIALEQIKSEFPQAKELISSYEAEIERLKDSISNIPMQQLENIDLSSLEKAEEEVKSFDQVLQGIRPLDFSGSAFELEKFVTTLQNQYESLLSKMEKFQELGVSPDTQRFQGLQYELQQVMVTLEKYEQKLEEARAAGELDFKFPSIDKSLGQATAKVDTFVDKIRNLNRNLKITVPTESLQNVEKELQKLKEQYDQIIDSINRKSQTVDFYGTTTDFKNKQIELEEIRNRYQELIQLQEQLSKTGGGGFKLNLEDFKKNLSKLESGLKKVNSLLTAFAKKIISANSASKSAKSALESFNLANMKLAKSIMRVSNMLKLMIVRMALRSVIDGVKSGFENLTLYSDEFANSVSMMKSALATLGNSATAAVSPLLNALAPALTTIIKWFTAATNAINQFFSALTGKTTWIKAKEIVAGVGDAASGAAKSAKQAAKDIQKSVRAFDELKVINLPDESASGGGAGGGTSGGGYEEVPIAEQYKKWADDIKEIMATLFEPFKEAWNREGQFVMESWKYALGEVGALFKIIGQDALEVWGQEASIAIWQDLLHILGDIGLIVGNLASGFRDAWSENETGKKILEGIRDILGIIVGSIRDAADATVIWSADLDFSPLLSKIQEYIESLKPVFETLSGIILDFYTMVLLPLGEWTLEKGLPDLVQVFIDFNEKVDWVGLRSNLQEFWKHLEPFAKTVGEGLIIFIRDCSNAVANFVNSQAFENFLKRIEDWMDNVTPEDVADSLKKIAIAIVVLKIALAGFKGISGFVTAINTLKSFAGIAAGIGSKIASGVAIIKTSLWLMTQDIGLVLGAGTAAEIGATFALALVGAIVAAVGGFKIGEKISTALGGETFGMSFKEQMGYIKDSFADGDWKEAINLWGQDLKEGWSEIFEGAKKFGNDLKTSLVATWGVIKTKAGEKFGEIKSTVSKKWDEIKTNTIAAWGVVKEKITTNATAAWSGVKTKWEGIKTSTQQNFEDAKNKAKEKFDGIKEDISGAAKIALGDIQEKWKNIASETKSKFEEAKGKVETNFNAAKKVISDATKDMRDKVKERFEAIRDKIKNTMDTAKQKIEGFKQKIDKAITSITNFFNFSNKDFVITLPLKIFDDFKEKVSGAVDKLKDLFGYNNKNLNVNANANTGSTSGGASTNTASVPQYATGGFPKSYSMFMAGENGRAELLGTVGGKTAVAGGAEITGIRDAVNETGQAEARLLQTAVSLLEIIAEKDYGITQNDIGKAAQNFSRDYMRRTGKPAYEF